MEGGGRQTEVETGNGYQEWGLFPRGLHPPDSSHTLESTSPHQPEAQKACSPVGQSQPPSPVGTYSPQSLLPVAVPKQVSTPALGFQVFSQPAPPHLIAFQSANPWPTPSAPARQATSVWPAVASETSHGPRPSLGQPLDSPRPNHIRLALPHTSDSPLTNISKPSGARSSAGPKQPTNSFPTVPLAPPIGRIPAIREEQLAKSGVAPTVQFPELIVLSRALALIKGQLVSECVFAFPQVCLHFLSLAFNPGKPDSANTFMFRYL